ncbi:MAG: hypothetical protein WC863_01355 [Patescibacteria group bacterium]
MSTNFKLSGFSRSLIYFSFFLVFAFLAGINSARAENCRGNTNINFVVLDPSGAFIPNARVDVYEQTTDFYDQPKPKLNRRFAGASTDAVLGTAFLSWRNNLMADTYAIRVQVVGKDNASFWYYGYNFSCGESQTISKRLSGILFVLRDTDGNPLKNTNFNVYSQQYDSNKKPLKSYKEQLTNLNTGAAGQVKVYLPQGSLRSMDNTPSDDYALELSRNNSKFIYYNIAVHDEQLTTLSYYLSSLRVSLQDTSGALFPSGTKVEIFKQEVGADNERQKGARVTDFSISTDGYGSIEIPAGTYVLGVKGQSNNYQYFWDVDVLDGQSNEKVITATQVASPVATACQNNSKLTVILRNASGNLIPNLKFEIYEQNSDANGLPVAGNKVGGGTMDKTGKATISFAPDPRKTYALKAWDKRADLGDFWFFDAVRFVCNYDRTVTKYLPALKIILRDSQKRLKANYNFSLYAQQYDADEKPFFENSDLIANLKTDAGGKSIVYVASYNPYHDNQSGVYVLSVKDAGGNIANVYNIKIPLDKDYTFNYVFSSLSGELRNGQKKILTNREIRFYEQLVDNGQKSLGRQLLKTKSDLKGRFQFDYPAGIYALVVLDDFNQENIFWNINIKSGQLNSQKLVTNTTKISLTNLASTERASTINLKLYNLSTEGDRKYYRDSEIGVIKIARNKTVYSSLTPGYYLLVYTDKSGKEYGRAFKANNGQLQSITLSATTKMRISSSQAFKF